MNIEKISSGIAGEALAAEFLASKGYEIVTRNYRYGRYGEIDLIVRKEDTTVFVEVRSRKGKSFGGAAMSVTKAKKNKILMTARSWMQRFGQGGNFRFDLLAVQDGSVEWIQDIIR